MSETEVMLNRHAESALFSLCNELLDEVGEYDYLGHVVIADVNFEKDFRCTIAVSWGEFGEHFELMHNKLPLSLKINAHNQYALLVVTCGAETRKVIKNLKKEN